MKSIRITFEGRRQGGFTLLELAVVLAVIATLGALLLPGWIRGRARAQSVQCLGNLRQLGLGWHMYAGDNSGILAPNDYPAYMAYATLTQSVQHELFNWVVGTMEQPVDSVNLAELTCPNTALAKYVGSPYLYHCPADNEIDPFSHQRHVRSYSMNAFIGTIWWSSFQPNGPPLGSDLSANWSTGWMTNNLTNWLAYGRMSSFTRPGPANTWLIMDENPYSINDGSMFVSPYATNGQTYLEDFPSTNHNYGAGIGFVDGHAIIHTWLDPRTEDPFEFGVAAGHGSAGQYATSTEGVPPGGDDQDCFYLASITSALR